MHEKQTEQDALDRVNAWLDCLEDQTRRLCAAFTPEDLTPAQASAMVSKYILLMAKLLELRQHFTTNSNEAEERLLQLILEQADDEQKDSH